MGNRKKESVGSGSRMLGSAWLVVSAGLAYPAFKMLVSMGFNQALAGVTVFIGACLLYEIPYRAKVRAQNEIAAQQSQRWRGRSC